MENLPMHLLNEILFRVDHRSLAMLQCSKKSFHSHISSDPYFKSEYFSRIRSGLLQVSVFSSHRLHYHSSGDSMPPRTINISSQCQIMGSCSGLLVVLFVGGLCVANPLTKKFRFLSFTENPLLDYWNYTKYMGLAVHQIDQTTNTKSFKIVCMTEVTKLDRTTYSFEINAGDSWRLSNSRITCCPSNLDKRTRRPVFFDGYLHWLRRDGSIIAFNPETEQGRVIPIKFPQKLSLHNLFAAGDNSLTLISGTKEVIDVYALENILTDPKWVLMRQIRNGVLDKKSLNFWEVAAYDGKCLVLKEYFDGRVLHGYDLRANKWEVMGSINGFCDSCRDFFQFIPSSSSVIGLDLKEEEVKLACYDQSISALRSIMRLVIDGVSLENEKATETKPIMLRKKKIMLVETTYYG